MDDREIDDLADKVYEKVMEKVYADIGKSVVRKAIWGIGIVAAFAIAWATGREVFKF